MTAVLGWGTVLGVGGASAALGLWMRSLGIFSAGAAMIALRASAVPFGAPPSLEALGYDLPPLPTLLAMPLGLVPSLRWDPFAPILVSALAAGAAAWWLFRSLRAAGSGALASVAIAVAATAHPAWIYAAASGSGSVLAAALLVAALRLYRRWQRTGQALSFLASSFAVAFGGLARYDLFIVGWGIAMFTYFDPRSGGSLARAEMSGPRPGVVAAAPRSARLGDERLAFAVAYAAAVTGALGLWLVTTGLLTGDVLAFVARSRDAVAGPATAQPPVHALLVLVPAVVAAAAAALARTGSPAVIATAVIAGAAIASSIVGTAPLSLDAVVPLVPVTALLLGDLLLRHAGALTLALPAFLLAGALAIGLSPDWGEGHRGVADAMSGRAPQAMWIGERDAASAVRAMTGRVVVDPRTDAVATLLIGRPERIVAIDDVARDATGAPRADLVLARTPTGRGAADRIAAAWPTLYEGGVPWAKPAGTWPVHGEAAEYRLYAVRPVGGR